MQDRGRGGCVRGVVDVYSEGTWPTGTLQVCPTLYSCTETFNLPFLVCLVSIFKNYPMRRETQVRM